MVANQFRDNMKRKNICMTPIDNWLSDIKQRIIRRQRLEEHVRTLCEEPVPQHTIDFWIAAYQEFLNCEARFNRVGERYVDGWLTFAAYSLLKAQENLDFWEEKLGVHPYERKRYEFQ